MSIFATEFPVKTDLSKSAFVASSIAWIRGIRKSSVLQSYDEKELHDDDSYLESDETGETLQFKSFSSDTMKAIGVRHEMPDGSGLIWRTECVLSHKNSSSFLRVRGQCVANSAMATVSMPKKPFFITQAIDDGWGARDADFEVSSSPVYLADESLELAERIVSGKSRNVLPCVYVSRGNDNSISLNAEVLARKLAGLAHVVVEPSRKFSFQLMELSLRKNPYGGAVGVFSSQRGEVIRFHPKGSLSQIHTKIGDVIDAVVEFNSIRSASNGLEWQSLQELQGRALRQKMTDGLSNSNELNSYIDEFDKEIAAKDERIRNLEELLERSQARGEQSVSTSTDLLANLLIEQLGTQLYDGEFSDRLRFFLVRGLSESLTELDNRTRALIDRIVENSEFSGRSSALVNQIKAAGKDGNQVTANLGSILSGFGYVKRTDGKHVKFEPPTELFGVPTEIFPSTPSDSQRGGKNRASEVIRNMGLRSLR